MTLVTETLTPAECVLDHKDLVSNEFWAKYTGRIQKDLKFQRELGHLDESTQATVAARIANETFRLLKLFALQPTQGYGPSILVDVGWHMLILDTIPYREICQRIAGGYIDHIPGSPDDEDDRASMTDVVEAFEANGLGQADLELWIGAMVCGTGTCGGGGGDCKGGK